MARSVSLLLGLGATSVLMLAPFLLVRHMAAATHVVLPFLLLGVAGVLVHGLGFAPRTAFIRAVFSPSIAWPLVVVGSIVLILIR